MTTCRVCSFQYADTEPRCPRCGFGSTTSMAAPPTASPPTVAPTGPEAAGQAPPAFVNLVPGVSVGPSGTSVAAPRRRGVLLIVVLILVALPIAGIVLAAGAINKVADTVIPEVEDLFRPDAGETGTTQENKISSAQCEQILSHYLKKMFFAMGKNPDKLSNLFIEASTRLGAGSDEYTALVEIFSTQKLSAMAATGNPAKAFKLSKPLIHKKCRD